MKVWGLLVTALGAVGAVASGLAWRVDPAIYQAMDPKRDFCVHAFHQSAIMDNKLYIVGGFVVYNYNNTRYEEPNTYLRTLDLTQRFPINDPTLTNITFTPNPAEVPEISSGALWPTANTLYLASGVTEPVDGNFPNFTSDAANSLWTYLPLNSTWTNIQIPLTSTTGAVLPIIAGASSAFIPTTNIGYLAGGNQDPWNAVGWPGMLIYDASAKTWENVSTPFQQRSSGQLIHVPIGKKGILVSLGGTRNNQPFPMTQLEIYNLDDETWSPVMQPATGASKTIPAPRTAFCAVLASSPDNTTFQIFVYGGSLAGSGDLPQLDDVWVLNMPSFEWFQVYAGGVNATNSNAVVPGKREAHTCHAVGRSMLVYGGRSKPQEDQVCDRTGVFVFDMVALSWTGEFVLDAGAYRVPGVVAGHGNSSMPTGGMADKKIQAMFEGIDSTEGDHGQGNKIELTETTESYSGGPGDTRRVVGIVLGSVIGGLGLVGLTGFFFLRRAKRQRLEKEKEQEAPFPFAEVPEQGCGPYYTAEMPENRFYGWELPAGPRDSALLAPVGSVAVSRQ